MNIKNNKECKKTFRLSDEELSLLTLKANLAGINISSYLRQMLVSSKPPMHKFDKALVAIVNKIENDLNRIAKRVDTEKEIDLIALKEIVSAREALNEIIAIVGEKNKTATKNKIITYDQNPQTHTIDSSGSYVNDINISDKIDIRYLSGKASDANEIL